MIGSRLSGLRLVAPEKQPNQKRTVVCEIDKDSNNFTTEHAVNWCYFYHQAPCDTETKRSPLLYRQKEHTHTQVYELCLNSPSVYHNSCKAISRVWWWDKRTSVKCHTSSPGHPSLPVCCAHCAQQTKRIGSRVITGRAMRAQKNNPTLKQRFYCANLWGAEPHCCSS